MHEFELALAGLVTGLLMLYILSQLRYHVVVIVGNLDGEKRTIQIISSNKIPIDVLVDLLQSEFEGFIPEDMFRKVKYGWVTGK